MKGASFSQASSMQAGKCRSCTHFQVNDMKQWPAQGSVIDTVIDTVIDSNLSNHAPRKMVLNHWGSDCKSQL